MKPRQTNTEHVLASEAVAMAEFLAKSTDLLDRTKENTRSIEQRCREVMRMNPDH